MVQLLEAHMCVLVIRPPMTGRLVIVCTVGDSGSVCLIILLAVTSLPTDQRPSVLVSEFHPIPPFSMTCFSFSWLHGDLACVGMALLPPVIRFVTHVLPPGVLCGDQLPYLGISVLTWRSDVASQ